MADTKVKNPVVIVGTKAQVESTTMGENDFAIVTDQEFYTKAEVDELLSGGGASLPILMSMWSDHVINDMSWLRADTFSWQSGDVYKAVYEHLSADLSNVDKLYCWYGDTRFYTKSETPSVGDTVYTITGSDTGWTIEEIISNSVVLSNGYSGSRDSANDELLSYTDVIDGTTITYYVAQDGHKISLPDQESNLVALYEATGVAWYYVLDTENKQFKLPRTKWGFTGMRDSVGGYVAPGLPNITAWVNFADNIVKNSYNAGLFQATNGAFKATSATGNTVQTTDITISSQTVSRVLNLDASLANAIYGNGDTVQPPATQMYLYFYVGNFEQSAIEQTAGITSETLNKKADADLGNIPTNYDYVVESQMPTADNGYTWYRKYKSGWLEQGGKLSGRSVVFPCAFSQVPTVCTSTIETNTGVVANSVINNVTETGFAGYKTQGKNDWDSGAQNMNGYWTAVGIAE